MSAFQIELRREPGYELRVNVRFRVLNGLGVLALPGRGRPDSAPVQLGDESDISADALRAGRFVHHVTDARRQAYSFSRLTPDLLARVPDDRFLQLEATTEFGFRYIVLAEELPPPSTVVSIRMPPSGKTPVPVDRVPRMSPAAVGDSRSLLERTRGRGENTPVEGTPSPGLSFGAIGKLEDGHQDEPIEKPPLFQEPSGVMPLGLLPGSQLAMPSPEPEHPPQEPKSWVSQPVQPPPPPPAPPELAGPAALGPIAAPRGVPSAGEVAKVSSRVPSLPPEAPSGEPSPIPTRPKPLEGPLNASRGDEATEDDAWRLLEAKVVENDRLLQHIARLERHLAERARREKELLKLLTAWQGRLPEI